MKREIWVARHVFLPNRKGRKQARKIAKVLRKIINSLSRT